MLEMSDYENIDPMYGTMKDFERLASAAKEHHIRIIMDFVLNHSSDKRPWFLDSASSRTSAHRDWYIWRDGKYPACPSSAQQVSFDLSAQGLPSARAKTLLTTVSAPPQPGALHEVTLDPYLCVYRGDCEIEGLKWLLHSSEFCFLSWMRMLGVN